jgi:hypothetical protein
MPRVVVGKSSFASIQAPIFSPKMPAILAFLWTFAGICHSVNFQKRCLAPLRAPLRANFHCQHFGFNLHRKKRAHEVLAPNS